MSAGWDAAVERASTAASEVYQSFREDLPAWEWPTPHDSDFGRVVARAALTAAVGPGGLILEAEDVAILGRFSMVVHNVVKDERMALTPNMVDELHADLDRLRELLGGEGAG